MEQDDTGTVMAARSLLDTAFHAAEYGSRESAQAYATIALAHAVIALIDRLDRLTAQNALRVMDIGHE